VPVAPGISAREVCELATKKTKVAIFENLFCLFECLTDGTQNVLDPTTDVYELLLEWGEESENHLLCDLNLDTKKTVKSHLRKTMARDTFYDGFSDNDDENGANFDDLDDEFDEEAEDHKSIELMIQEMIKLKRQLQEEDDMIEQLAVEEQQVDMLISRLANL